MTVNLHKTDQPPEDAGALGSWLAPSAESRVEEIAIELVRDAVWRPAHDSSDPAYRALKASIRASGILQPLLLRPRADGTFEVVSGARRLRAARETVQSAVPAIVRELSDLEALVGGWDSMLRSGLSGTERDQLRVRLGLAGMSVAEADALLATVPWRDAGSARVAASTPPPPPAVPATPPIEVVEPAAPIVIDDPAAIAMTPATPGIEAESIVDDGAAAAVLDEGEFAGFPMDVVGAPTLAPTDRPRALPVDPVIFPVGPLEPILTVFEDDEEVDDAPSPAPPEPAVAVAPPEPAAAAAPVIEVIAEVPVQAPEQPSPAVTPGPAAAIVAIDLPAVPTPSPSQGEILAPPVVAPPAPTLPQPSPPTPIAPPTPSVSAPPSPSVPGPTVTWREPVLPTPPHAAAAAPAPQDPVPSIADARRGQTSSSLGAIVDPRTVATVGVAAAVGAIVFIIVAVLLGAGAGRPLTIAIVVALVGFFLAIVSLALPRRDL